jgi:hypothetical protein
MASGLGHKLAKAKHAGVDGKLDKLLTKLAHKFAR